MIEEKFEMFTDEEIKESARENLASVCLATMSYLQENALEIDAYWTYIGHQFASHWQDVTNSSARDIARIVALNMVTGLSQVKSFMGDENHAEIVFTNWPPEEMINAFDVSPQRTLQIYEIFRPIMSSLGFNYEWKQQGEDVVVTIGR